MKFTVSDEVESSNNKKIFCLLSIMMSGVVSGLDVNQCPASNDLSNCDFGVEQLITASNVKMKIVHIAAFAIVSLCVNCKTFDLSLLMKKELSYGIAYNVKGLASGGVLGLRLPGRCRPKNIII